MRICAVTATKSSRLAFTLMEILVVIAVIAILAAFLTPVFLSARMRSRATVCSSNLHQLDLAVMQYASDHDGMIPPYPTDFSGTFVNPVTGTKVPMLDHASELTVSLNPYIKEASIWFCLSDTFARTASREGYVNHLFTSYKTGKSWYLTMDTPILGQTRKDNPTLLVRQGLSDTPLFTDDLWGCATGGPEVSPSYSHGNRYNVIMFDGHVASFSRDHPFCYGWD